MNVDTLLHVVVPLVSLALGIFIGIFKGGIKAAMYNARLESLEKSREEANKHLEETHERETDFRLLERRVDEIRSDVIEMDREKVQIREEILGAIKAVGDRLHGELMLASGSLNEEVKNIRKWRHEVVDTTLNQAVGRLGLIEARLSGIETAMRK